MVRHKIRILELFMKLRGCPSLQRSAISLLESTDWNPKENKYK